MANKNKLTYIFFEGAPSTIDMSMLELRSQITEDEWISISKDTIIYGIFLSCLKNVAMPILDEKWAEKDESILEGILDSTTTIKNIDPLIIAKTGINIEETTTAFENKMRTNAKEVLEQIRTIADLENNNTKKFVL